MRQVLRQRLREAFAFSSVSATVSALVTLCFFGFQAVPLVNGFAIGFFASFFIMALNATALDRAALERRALLFMDLRAKDTSYLSRYGLVPRFRAGCHLGSVVTGQLGLLKKEITYLGDVMNSASRIMDESKRLG